MNDGHAILELIRQDPETAWRRLVDDYSGLILALIARYNPHQDARMDAYLYVLEQLASDDMRRIRRYGQGVVENPCQFTTWLKLVVRNLYFDWFRHRHGRKSVPKEIQKLGEREQRIFKLVYWDGYPPRQAFEIFRTNDSTTSYERFLTGLSKVDARLTAINRAKIHRDFLRAVGPMSLDIDNESGPPIEAKSEVKAVPPDRAVQIGQARGALAKLLHELPPEDRVLVRLWFYEGMTAKEIAAATGVADPMLIYRRIEKICSGLARSARAAGLDQVLLEADPGDLADSDLPAALDTSGEGAGDGSGKGAASESGGVPGDASGDGRRDFPDPLIHPTPEQGGAGGA